MRDSPSRIGQSSFNPPTKYSRQYLYFFLLLLYINGGIGPMTTGQGVRDQGVQNQHPRLQGQRQVRVRGVPLQARVLPLQSQENGQGAPPRLTRHSAAVDTLEPLK